MHRRAALPKIQDAKGIIDELEINENGSPSRQILKSYLVRAELSNHN